MNTEETAPLGERHTPQKIVFHIDKEFELKLIDFLRRATAPQTAQALAEHFAKSVHETEHYLDRLDEQGLARYIRHAGAWGWVAVKPDKR